MPILIGSDDKTGYTTTAHTGEEHYRTVTAHTDGNASSIYIYAPTSWTSGNKLTLVIADSSLNVLGKGTIDRSNQQVNGFYKVTLNNIAPIVSGVEYKIGFYGDAYTSFYTEGGSNIGIRKDEVNEWDNIGSVLVNSAYGEVGNYLVYVEGSIGGPTISDIDGDDKVYPGQSAIISGVDFGASQGTVDLGGIAQTITSWSDTSITILVTQSSLAYGDHDLNVTDSNAVTSGIPIVTTLTTSPTASIVTLSSPIIGTTSLLDGSSPVAVSGDVIEFDDITNLGFAITVNPDGTYSVLNGGESLQTFNFRFRSSSGGKWSNQGTVTVNTYGPVTVTNVTGVISVGNTLTVTGQNLKDFGGHIIVWDTFEGQTLGNSTNGASTIKGSKNWSNQYGYSGPGLTFDDTRSHSGTKAVHVDWAVDAEDLLGFGFNNENFTEAYVTYQRYMTGDFVQATANVKQYYLFGTIGEMPQGMPLIPAGQVSWGYYNNVSDPGNTNNINTLGWSYYNTRDVFQRWEFLTALNPDISKYEGVIKVWLDGELGIDVIDYRSRNVDGVYKDLRIGHMASDFEDTAHAWYDEVYVATTPARIELSSSQTYAGAIDKQIQCVDELTWTNTGVDFTLNDGINNFTGDVYLYIVDKYGIANENGYQIV